MNHTRNRGLSQPPRWRPVDERRAWGTERLMGFRLDKVAAAVGADATHPRFATHPSSLALAAERSQNQAPSLLLPGH